MTFNYFARSLKVMMQFSSVMKPVVRASSFAVPASSGPHPVVHLGQNSLLLGTGGGLLPITNPSRGLNPGGFQLSHRDFAAVREYLAVPAGALSCRTAISGGLSFAGLAAAIDSVPVADLRLYPVEIPADAGGLVFELPLPLHVDQEVLAAFGRVSHLLVHPSSGRDSAFVADLQTVIGAGLGATPSGDDFLTGLLAGFWLRGGAQLPAWFARGIRNSLSLTTTASKQQLQFALVGEFSTAFLDLASLAASRVSLTEILSRAERIGHTSGADFLWGIATYLCVSRPQNFDFNSVSFDSFETQLRRSSV